MRFSHEPKAKMPKLLSNVPEHAKVWDIRIENYQSQLRCAWEDESTV